MKTLQRNPLRRPLALTAVTALALLPAARWSAPASAQAGEEAARILVTNDDGWDSDGLAALVASLMKLGEVVVCAPLQNRSGASHSAEIFRGEHALREVTVEGASEAWAVDGTPSDAVTFALTSLGGERGFDLVVSGINAGANVGEVAHYSGTVGAALEAVGLGVAAIAVSQEAPRGFADTARFTADLARRLLTEGADAGVVYSVNVPRHRAEGPQPVAVAPMGGRFLRVAGVRISDPVDGQSSFRAELEFGREAPEGSDTRAFFAGAITITPLRFDWTDTASLERLRKWELTSRE
ncbi:MAG: 5'/3'-nucleotidase SurE [Planctomycetes bacterium]|nr:5'/3'-nucleotidase SurE [Planctomycetota bacterium]